MNKIVVLMATYNGLNFLPEQVDSILNQADVDVTLYVSDDNSSDGTFDWLQRLARTDNRIKLLPIVNRMGSAGRNFYRLVCDVDISIFDYVAFADQDDIWREDKIIIALSYLSSLNNSGYSSAVTAFWDSSNKKSILLKLTLKNWMISKSDISSSKDV